MFLRCIRKFYDRSSTINLDSSSANTDFDKANLFNCCFHSVLHYPSDLPVINELPDIVNFLCAINISVIDVRI